MKQDLNVFSVPVFLWRFFDTVFYALNWVLNWVSRVPTRGRLCNLSSWKSPDTISIH